MVLLLKPLFVTYKEIYSMNKKNTLSMLLVIGFTTGLYAQIFKEVSAISGIDHVYVQSSHMGGGAAFFDFDNDGWEDVYITGGALEDALYKNNQDGTFKKVLNAGFAITNSFYTIAVVSGDVNNDGFRDLFVTTWIGGAAVNQNARNLLFINNSNGTFTESGINAGIVEPSFTMGATMLDYNNDGLLDIYAVNYVEISNPVTDTETEEVIGFDHTCFPNFFYENNGDGTFTEKAAIVGVNDIGCALAVMPTNFDQDHDQDIYIANDFGEFIVSNALYQNNIASTSFSNASMTTNMNVGIYAMGIAYADIDKDADYDYYITNLGRNVLLENNGNQVFSDITTTAGAENTFTLDSPGDLFTTGWGTAFLDVNNDTWPDLFVANGKVPAVDFIATGETDPNKLYINNGDSTFSDVSVSAGIDDTNRARGMAYCDYDKDGDLDVLVVVQNGGIDSTAKTLLYENQLNPNESSGENWVQLNLKGTAINKDAIGARVILTVNGEKLIQEVHGQGSHCSQHSLVLHFGLASNIIIEKMEIIWSSTSTETFFNIPVNTRHTITQNNGTLSTPHVDLNTTNAFVLFPNPVKDKLFIANLKEESHITIATIDGKILKKDIVHPSKNSIDLEFLPKGIYAILITSYNQTYNQLIIKQ